MKRNKKAAIKQIYRYIFNFFLVYTVQSAKKEHDLNKLLVVRIFVGLIFKWRNPTQSTFWCYPFSICEHKVEPASQPVDSLFMTLQLKMWKTRQIIENKRTFRLIIGLLLTRHSFYFRCFFFFGESEWKISLKNYEFNRFRLRNKRRTFLVSFWVHIWNCYPANKIVQSRGKHGARLIKL